MYILSKSTRKDKKYMINIDGKIIHFGQEGASDYTQHNDNKRKMSYLQRHYKNENWDDINTAGAWSRWLLWNKKSLKKSISDMENRFNIKIMIV